MPFMQCILHELSSVQHLWDELEGSVWALIFSCGWMGANPRRHSQTSAVKKIKWKLLGQEIDGLFVLYLLVLFCLLLALYPLIKTHYFHLASLKSEIHHLWHIQCMCEVTTTRLPHEASVKLNLVVVNSMAFIPDWVHKKITYVLCTILHTHNNRYIYKHPLECNVKMLWFELESWWGGCSCCTNNWTIDVTDWLQFQVQ